MSYTTDTGTLAPFEYSIATSDGVSVSPDGLKAVANKVAEYAFEVQVLTEQGKADEIGPIGAPDMVIYGADKYVAYNVSISYAANTFTVVILGQKPSDELPF